MGISLKPKHLKRYRDIALLLIKYGRSDVVKHAGLQDALEPDASVETTTGESKADELAQDLEKMGPTYIKLGQLLSTRADFLPSAYIHALTRLQDKIDPFPFEQVSEKVLLDKLNPPSPVCASRFIHQENRHLIPLTRLHQGKRLRDKNKGNCGNLTET